MTRDEYARSAIAQVLPPRQEQVLRIPLRDWSSRQRLSAVEALRYSRFVVLMKSVLPLAAIALMASVVAYAVFPRHQEKLSVTMKSSGNVANDLTMTKATFTGTDEKNNHFTVTAAEVVQDPKNQRRAVLKQVQADMEFDKGNWMSASAGRGLIDVDAGTLKLTGGLAIFTDTGYELHTPSADVNMKKDIMEGTQSVTGHGPLGKLSADRFRFDRIHKMAYLNGHVHMTMFPNKAKRK